MRIAGGGPDPLALGLWTLAQSCDAPDGFPSGGRIGNLYAAIDAVKTYTTDLTLNNLALLHSALGKGCQSKNY